jgi:hypothetical protein
MFLVGVFAFSRAVIVYVTKHSEEYETKSKADQEREDATILSKAFAIPIYCNKGVDYIYSKIEQEELDWCFIIGTIVVLVFMGHSVVAFMWIVYGIAKAIILKAFKGFDEAILEEL